MSIVDGLTRSEREQLRPEGLPGWLDPMLATLTDEHFSDPDWIYERKLDGERVVAYLADGQVRLLSRNGKQLGDSYPELEDALADLAVDEVILDGEIVAFDGDRTSFSRLQPRMQVTDRDEARSSDIRVFFYLFDLLHLQGHSTRQLPLRRRKSLLHGAITFEDPLRWVPHRNEDGEQLLEEACAKGWEGLIAKRADAPYHHGRSRDWLKFKCVAQQEFVIGGFTEPQGERDHLGALLVGHHDDQGLRYAGKVGTGYDQRTLEQLSNLLGQRERDTSPFADDVAGDDLHWVTPDLVAQIGFTEWTDDGRLRHPRYLGLRDDKDAQQVVRETADPRARPDRSA